ncbi:MAG: CZB domain-containing protein [Burkholderiaceae bacterium]
MDLQKAIAAHGEWKMKFRTAIADKAKLDAAAISTDNACPLGKWLHGEAKIKFGKMGTYGKCLAEHAAFHKLAGQVATAINAGQYDKANAMIGMNTDYSKASTAVTSAIMALKREAKI